MDPYESLPRNFIGKQRRAIYPTENQEASLKPILSQNTLTFRKIMAPWLNQIQTWLKRSIIWRLAGFVSAIVGLLCYGLSSSFNSLFGEWNLLKTFLYCVLSFIIGTAVLFANVWQRSTSLRPKAHMAFLVLTITSFYSFFFDKAAKGKPDAYSLVSCAAFAVMLLSLSRQIHCGFEVDLLYFFLGALIVQLMKITWLLGIAGAGFSYSLIILRSYINDPSGEANGYPELEDEPHVVIQIGGSLQSQSSANSASALVATSQEEQGNTQGLTITEVDSRPHDANTDFAFIKSQLLASIKALNNQSRKLIGIPYGQALLKHFQPDHNLLIDALPSKFIDNLKEVVKLAMAAGFEKECCHLYSIGRREFLRQCLSILELEDLNYEVNNVDKKMTTLDKISSWKKAFKTAIRILFPNERRLCDRVFSGFSSAGDLSFVLVCEELTVRVLSFVNTIEVDVRSPYIFTRAVKKLDDFGEMIPQLVSLFPDEYGASLRNEAIMTQRRLGETIRDVFKQLENLIRCDSTVVDAQGGIYPITLDVMNCLGGIVRVEDIIEKAFEKYHVVANRDGTSPSLPAKMAWIVQLLEDHLEAKFKDYTEPALGYVATMNNTMYIKQHILQLSSVLARFKDEDKVKRYSSLGKFWGDDWIQKHTAKCRPNLEDYKKSSWNEVVGLLKLDSNIDELVALTPDETAESMKEKLKLFNIQFQEICRIQSRWFAIDEIRNELIISLENMLLPAYGNFIGKLQDVLGKEAYGYIQYGMFDIKALLNKLFLGGKLKNQ